MRPVLFSVGPLTVYWYGVFVALAFLAALATAAGRLKRYGWRPEIAYDIGIYALLAAIAGSRLLYILEDPREFLSSPLEIFKVWKGGLSFLGGLAGAVLAGAVYLRLHRLPVLAGFDLLVPSVALGHAVGRIGCFLNGCCFGAASGVPWAVVFPDGSAAHAYQLREAGLLPPGSAWSIPVHPVQIYESLAEIGIFVALSCCLPRSRFRGEIFLLYLFLYGIARFVLEEFRADTPAILAVGRSALSLPQLTGLGMALVSAALILAAGRRRQGA
ncbi:MAG TPA: prolipoprotein diacylglyceryl transferase [bacterium]|nr:prolipoprotein diacylglyceryl transferase [Chlamydiota bacterium]HOE26197.1 prolipoprotein diacylglyceryl transferase [bacterium]HQM53475.1 prolipoprotein diacylglyceryl transferase [bacterium]